MTDELEVPQVGDEVTVDEGIADDVAVLLKVSTEPDENGHWVATVRWEGTAVEETGTVYYDGLLLFVPAKRG